MTSQITYRLLQVNYIINRYFQNLPAFLMLIQRPYKLICMCFTGNFLCFQVFYRPFWQLFIGKFVPSQLTYKYIYRCFTVNLQLFKGNSYPTDCTDGKLYKRASNACVNFFHSLGKFYAVLLQKIIILQFRAFWSDTYGYLFSKF